MNILCINHEYPPVGGGAATVTRELLTRLNTRGHQIVLLTEKVPGNAPNHEEPEFPVFRVHAGRKSVSQGSYFEFICFFIKSLTMLRKIHKEFKPDITFAFFTIPGGLLALVQKWWYGTPYIVSVRGGDIPGFITDKKLAFSHFLSTPLIRLVCKKAALIHTNSERLKKLTEKLIPDVPVKIIPNGVVFDTTCLSEILTGNSNEQKDAFIKIVFAGRLSKQKNLDTFLLGIAKLPDDIKEKIKFTIVGEGQEKRKLENLAEEYRLSHIVCFRAWVDRNDLKIIYKSHTFSVIPSLDEGMPNSALESIISGCPVLGSQRGSLPWEEKGLSERWIIKNELDATEWKNRIVFLVNNREFISKDFIAMYQTVTNRFDWASLFSHYETMIRLNIHEHSLNTTKVTYAHIK